MKSLTDALNVAYDVQEQRGFFQHNALTLALTFGALAMVAGLLLVTAAIPAILDRFWLGWASETLLNYGRWPMLLLLLITGLALLYRFGPNLPNARWRWISPGSVVASTGLIVFSILFSWYAVNFGNYNKTYGSLGAVIAFMTWTWLSTMIVLIGAELNAVLDKLQRPARSWWLKVAPR